MTQRLYRTVLVTTALVWLEAGMRVSHVATVKDAGGTPEPSEWLALVLVAILGTIGVMVLWRHPATRTQVESNAPAT